MNTKYRRLKGTRDIMLQEAERWRWCEERWQEVLERYGSALQAKKAADTAVNTELPELQERRLAALKEAGICPLCRQEIL